MFCRLKRQKSKKPIIAVQQINHTRAVQQKNLKIRLPKQEIQTGETNVRCPSYRSSIRNTDRISDHSNCCDKEFSRTSSPRLDELIKQSLSQQQKISIPSLFRPDCSMERSMSLKSRMLPIGKNLQFFHQRRSCRQDNTLLSATQTKPRTSLATGILIKLIKDKKKLEERNRHDSFSPQLMTKSYQIKQVNLQASTRIQTEQPIGSEQHFFYAKKPPCIRGSKLIDQPQIPLDKTWQQGSGNKCPNSLRNSMIPFRFRNTYLTSSQVRLG